MRRSFFLMMRVVVSSDTIFWEHQSNSNHHIGCSNRRTTSSRGVEPTLWQSLFRFRPTPICSWFCRRVGCRCRSLRCPCSIRVRRIGEHFIRSIARRSSSRFWRREWSDCSIESDVCSCRAEASRTVSRPREYDGREKCDNYRR